MANFDILAPQKEQFDTMGLTLMGIANKLGSKNVITDPRYIKAVCDSGLAQQVFSVGDQIEVARENSLSVAISATGVTNATVDEETFLDKIDETSPAHEFIYDGAIWKYKESAVTMADYGIVVTGTPAKNDIVTIKENLSYYKFDIAKVGKYGIYLLMHNMFEQYAVFDAPEGLMKFVSGLSAGNYTIKLDHGAYGQGTAEDGYYYFTTTSAIPSGGYIRHSNMGGWRSSYSPSAVQSGTFTTYNASYTLIETISSIGYSSTAPSGYTLLGTTSTTKTYIASGSVDAQYININNCGSYGRGHYGESNIRQRLNSNKAKNTYFVPQNEFDFPTAAMSSSHGFRHGLDKVFDSVVSTSPVVCGCNPSFGYADTTYTCNDKYFLASRIEMGYGIESGFQEGTVLDMYNGVPNSKRIKYINGNPYYWWLRSPNPDAGGGGYERRVGTGGSLNDSGADGSYGLVPACIIGSIQ